MLSVAEDLLKAYCSFASFGAREVRRTQPDQAFTPLQLHYAACTCTCVHITAYAWHCFFAGSNV